MCGRTAAAMKVGVVGQAMAYQHKGVRQEPALQPQSTGSFYPSHNICPQQSLPVVVCEDGAERSLAVMRWGLKPSWAGSGFDAPKVYPINARIESVLEKPSFYKPLCRGQRCVVVVQGFYEWQAASKQPHFIHAAPDPQAEVKQDWLPGDHPAHNSPLLAMAGIYDICGDERTFTIITMPAAPYLEWLHERMPAVLSTPEEVSRWLDTSVPAEEAVKGLKQCLTLRWFAVDKLVGNVKKKEYACMAPLGSTNVATAETKSMLLKALAFPPGAQPKATASRPSSLQVGKSLKTSKSTKL
eukprot:m.44323 g.44323  ORF g.44323 m.44323 type:complete len:298 (+) comp12318_c1_seq1:106-999(+)